MIPLRITDPKVIDKVEVEKLYKERGAVCIQYSEPTYSADALAEINGLCEQYRERLEVRFYSHYSGPFDFASLRKLPSVVNLSVDCLRGRASNVEILGELKKLKIFSLGVDKLNFPEILSLPSLQNLEELRLGPTDRHPINLSPLAKYTKLRDLGIAGHSLDIDCLQATPCLEVLGLSGIKKNVKLGFISRMKALRSLSFLLGGRSNLSEIEHEGLRKLEVVRVMGFEEILLDAFPAIEDFMIEDQFRLRAIDFNKSTRNLKKIRLLNCKNLKELSGLQNLPSLEHLWIYKTSLDFERLIENGIPRNLKIFGFYDKSNPKTKAIRRRLEALGYTGNP